MRLDLVLEILLKPGDHVVANSEMAVVWADNIIPDEKVSEFAVAFELAGKRTPAQDIRYPFQQLTDVIIRALSPGINDPFTAINGIDELASALSLLSTRPRVQEWRLDLNGELRALVPRPTIDEVLLNTVGHIAIYAARDHYVMERLRRVLDIVKDDLETDSERSELSALKAELDRRQYAEGNGI